MTKDEIIQFAQKCGASVMQPYDYGAKPHSLVFQFDDLVDFTLKIMTLEAQKWADACADFGAEDEGTTTNKIMKKGTK